MLPSSVPAVEALDLRVEVPRRLAHLHKGMLRVAARTQAGRNSEPGNGTAQRRSKGVRESGACLADFRERGAARGRRQGHLSGPRGGARASTGNDLQEIPSGGASYGEKELIQYLLNGLCLSIRAFVNRIAVLVLLGNSGVSFSILVWLVSMATPYPQVRTERSTFKRKKK